MSANPLIGVVYHWLGGLACASFYVPYRRVSKWAWETYWLVGGTFSWIIVPWIAALIFTPHLAAVLTQTPVPTLCWTYFWGVMWGLGGLTFGLTMRYLGMSLGMAVALGFCAAFGTLIPPLYHGTFAQKLLMTSSGRIILVGVGVCLLGIAIAGAAGMSKEREMSEDQKTSTIKEFNFSKGILVAVFSGIMSACFAFGLSAGKPISDIAVTMHSAKIWDGLPTLIVVLLGGFTSNFIWCALLNFKNHTWKQYVLRTQYSRASVNGPIIENAIDAPATEMATHLPVVKTAAVSIGKNQDIGLRVPLLNNYTFCALAGTLWYLQFFFYTMGESQMGRYKFSSWTLHMASIIIFSTLWGLSLREWKGSSHRTYILITLGLLVLVGSTLMVGYGNYLAAQPH